MAARKKKPAGTNLDLVTFVTAIEEIDASKEVLNEERKAVFDQAVEEGVDRKTLAKVIMRRRKERADILDEDARIAMYEQQLGMDALE